MFLKHQIAETIGRTVEEVERMSTNEFVHWAMYFVEKARREARATRRKK